MRNSFVRVQWAGQIVLQGNLIDDLRFPILGNDSVADNRFKITYHHEALRRKSFL
jgi:hypothetical protein